MASGLGSALTLFGLAHFYALADVETAITLFSVFMVAGSLAVIVAGVALARAGIWSGAQRFVPLLCGVRPVVTIPVGAALGDLPHFLAIAVWGACWMALGVALRAGQSQRGMANSQDRRGQHTSVSASWLNPLTAMSLVTSAARSATRRAPFSAGRSRKAVRSPASRAPWMSQRCAATIMT